ncbi:hypothetical protein [Burkholderia diffusa]|uniref:hypothetical protein n=1 Tax=Burkholderia diffusa TaxID=488732 RepID=UPI0018C6E2E6|nr:hypothetical protein [Burkholderia diffusa]
MKLKWRAVSSKNRNAINDGRRRMICVSLSVFRLAASRPASNLERSFIAEKRAPRQAVKTPISVARAAAALIAPAPPSPAYNKHPAPK